MKNRSYLAKPLISLFSPTCVINSVTHEDWCKIVYFYYLGTWSRQQTVISSWRRCISSGSVPTQMPLSGFTICSSITTDRWPSLAASTSSVTLYTWLGDGIRIWYLPYSVCYHDDLSFQTDRSWKTVYTLISLFLKEHLHCLPFLLHPLNAFSYGKTTLFKC